MNNNIATVNSIYEAFGKGDIAAIIERLSDDIKWEEWADNSSQKAGVPWMQLRNGKDGALDFFKGMSELGVKDFRVLSVMGDDSQVAAEVIFEADVLTTGRWYRDEEIHLWTFDEEGKVNRFRHYTDTAKHIAAAQAAMQQNEQRGIA